MAKPNRALVRFFFAGERENAVKTALGSYVEIDFLPASWAEISRVLRACTNVLIIKEVDLDPDWFYNRYADTATYDGTTLYVSCADYDTARELLCDIVREHAHYVNKPPFPGGQKPATN